MLVATLGWLDLPENYDREEFDRILKAAEQIKSDSDVLVVIGIGGSYLGAKAAIDCEPPLCKLANKRRTQRLHKSFTQETQSHLLTLLTW